MSLALPECTFAFQPIVDVHHRKVQAFEVLARGLNNESAASVFRRVPEESKYVFDEHLRVMAIPLAVQLGLDSWLSLNLLPRCLELSKTAIASTIEAAEASGFPCERIMIEVTEVEIVKDPQWFCDAVNQYRTLGVKFAIDDFGAGYSGLNLLAEFQPDYIKMDRILLSNIQSHGPRQAIVRGIIRTSEDLGIGVIAEGIETEDEFLWCYDEGIELFQGYYFAKPGFECLPSAYIPAYESVINA